MLDFGKFCYLHVEKTGGTYVSKILREISLLPLWHAQLHDTIRDCLSMAEIYQMILQKKNLTRIRGGVFRKNCLYFNTVRDPFTYYASLYNYGCDGKGGVAYAFQQHGKGYFYDGKESSFLNWVDFILDSKSAKIWHEEYDQSCAKSVGLLTYRFLRLSFSNPYEKLEYISNIEDAVSVYNKYNICDYTLRTESLNQDLRNLISGPLRKYVDVSAGNHLLDQQDKVNASVSGAVSGDMLRNSPVADKVVEREAFILKTFYNLKPSEHIGPDRERAVDSKL